MNDQRPVAIVAVVLDGEDFLLIRRGDSVPEAGYWAPVSGSVEPGESEPEAVVREVLEEVGLRVRPVRKVWDCVSASGTHDLHWWLAVPVSGELEADPREVVEVRWCGRNEYARLEPTFPTDRNFFESVLPDLGEAG